MISSPPKFDHKARVLSVFWNHTCTAALSGGPHLVRKQRAGSSLIMLYLSNPCFMVPTSRDLSASPSHQLVGGSPSHIGGTSGSSLKMKKLHKKFVIREVNYIHSTWLCFKCDQNLVSEACSIQITWQSCVCWSETWTLQGFRCGCKTTFGFWAEVCCCVCQDASGSSCPGTSPHRTSLPGPRWNRQGWILVPCSWTSFPSDLWELESTVQNGLGSLWSLQTLWEWSGPKQKF